MKPESEQAVDLAAVTALLALALAGLATTYEGQGWWVVALIGAFLAWGTAALARTWRWPGWSAPTLLVLLQLGLANLFVSTREGATAWLPDGESVAVAIRETFSAWRELIETLPRVDSDGAMLIIPMTMALFGGGGALLLAWQTRRPGLPGLPLLLVFIACLLLGRGDLGLRLVHGAAFATVLLGWVVVRGARLTPSEGAGSRLWSARAVMLLVAVLLGALISPWVLSDNERLVLRDTAARGLDTSDIATPLQGFRRYTPQPPTYVDNVHQERLLKVSGDTDDLRLRFAVLDSYDGEQWRTNPDVAPATAADRYLRVGSTIDNPAEGRLVWVRVAVQEAWRGNWVPTAGHLQSIQFVGSGEHNRRDEVRYNPATAATLLSTRLNAGDDYYFEARVPDDEYDVEQGPGTGVDPTTFDNAAFLASFAQGWLDAHRNPMESLLAASRTLRDEGRYSDGAFGWETRFRPGHDRRRLNRDFLRAPQMVGNAEQYASLVALLAVRMGIPARVVVGAEVPADGVVRGEDVQAWVEVQTADEVWRTLPTEEFLATRPPDPDPEDRQGDSSVSVLEPPEPRQLTQDEIIMKQRVAQQMKEEERARERAESLEANQRLLWWVLLGFLIVLVPVLKTVRRHARRTTGGPAERVAAAWEELLDQMCDLGWDVPSNAPRPDQARKLGVDRDLAARVDALAFDGGRSADAVVALWDEVREEAGRARARVRRWRRFVAVFSVRSFGRRRGRTAEPTSDVR